MRLGTAVFSGMLGVTLFGIFLTPVFYYVIRWYAERSEHPVNLPPAAVALDVTELDKTDRPIGEPVG